MPLHPIAEAHYLRQALWLPELTTLAEQDRRLGVNYGFHNQ